MSNLWDGHATADVATLEKQTSPIPVRIGVKEEILEKPRPDLNGLRVKLPTEAAIYLIDRGYRRWIPNVETYNNLFVDWSGVVVDININDIPATTSITPGAVLVRGHNETGIIYLIDNGVKRHIASRSIMDKYHFTWERVYLIPQILIGLIPTGSTIDS
jgi:hypothetical protein